MKLFSNKFVKNLKPFFKSNFRLLSTTNNYNLQVNFNNKFKKALFNKKNLFSFQKFNCGDKSKPVSDQTISENEALEIVEAGVFEVIKGAAKCNQDKLSRSAEFKDLGFDSLDQVELVVAMEEKFNLNISGNYISIYYIL